MFVQTKLVSTTEDTAVYWLDHNVEKQAPIRVGQGVRIADSDTYWLINQVCTTVRNLTDLPIKYRIGTIVELN